jgi:hypothetical protein
VGFDPGEFVELLAAYRGVTCFFVPTMVTPKGQNIRSWLFTKGSEAEREKVC